MPINTRHPAYDAIQADLKTMRDVMAGEGAVKKAGDTYLPKLGGQTPEEYEAYKKRALFYGACTRTLEALAGAVCRKAPVLHGPDAFVKKYGQDITGTGTSLATLTGDLVRETLTTGMEGILVDHNGTRPFLAPYSAENVINQLPDGTVVLSETEMVQDPKDKYVLKAQTNYRELFVTETGAAMVRIWKPDDKSNLIQGEDRTLEFRKKPLEVLPFALAQLAAMPLLPLAQTNLSHYLTSADLENGLHWGGIFTPWIASNIDPNDPKYSSGFKVGGSAAWLLPSGSQVGMLEVQGAALAALEARLLGKQELMAALGARLLIAPKKAVETAETSRINASGEGATLSLVVDAVEAALSKALKILAQWDGIAATEDIRVELNRDFVDASLTPQELTAYLATYQAGGMSLDAFLQLLQGGELLPAGRTVEDEKSLIEKDGAGGGGITLPTISRTKRAVITRPDGSKSTVEME